MIDFMLRLGEVVFGGAGEVWNSLPEHLRKDAKARLSDFDPFKSTPANEDLLRGLRLAWIEVALQIDSRVVSLTDVPEWRDDRESIQRFSGLLKSKVVSLRSQAFDRSTALPASPIDRHLQLVLTGVPRYVISRVDDQSEELGQEFRSTLAATLDWPINEVPPLYHQVANTGLNEKEGAAARAFGELVFAAFAEIVKHPSSNPEIATAFQIAQLEIARAITLQTLSIARGLDAKFDALLTRLEGVPFKSLEDFATQALAISTSLGRLTKQIEELPTQDQMAEVIERAIANSVAREFKNVASGLGGWIAHSPSEMLPAVLLRQVTRLYGDPDLPAAEIVPYLGRFALEYQALQQRIANEESLKRYGDARQKLAELVSRGDLAAAEALMAEEMARQHSKKEDLDRERAATMSDRGRLAYLRDDVVRMCIFQCDALHAVRFDRRLVWAYSLQTYTFLCREASVIDELEIAGFSGIGRDIGADWEGLTDLPNLPDSVWEDRDRIAAHIESCARQVIAKAQAYQSFRSWSNRIEAIAGSLLELARQSRNPLEARAAVAGFELYSVSFNTSDDPIDVDVNFRQVNEARTLLGELEGRPTGVWRKWL